MADKIVGQSLGRYHVLEQLGEGGMATVYKAYDTRLERDVAIKLIRRGAFPPEQLERILMRFEREAKALAKLSHPNIVGILDYGEYEGSPFLVMEYLPGGTLKQYLGKQVPWQQAVSALLPVARALEYAHEERLVHRDVKPSNILLTNKGQPMLSDFGIAKILESDDGMTLTGTGLGVGTPGYMAPEQWSGKVTGQADIYSLGVVLYELLTGRKPFPADTPAAILLKQASEPLPRPASFVPDLPEAVEKVLIRALARKEEDRFPDMGAFADALGKLTGGMEAQKMGAVAAVLPVPGRAGETAATIDQDAPPAATATVTEQDPPPAATAATIDQGVTATGATLDQGTIGSTREEARTVEDAPAPPASVPAGGAAGAPARKGRRKGCAWAAIVGGILFAVVVILLIIAILNGLLVTPAATPYEPEPTAYVRYSTPTSVSSGGTSPTNPPASGSSSSSSTTSVPELRLCQDVSSGACVYAFGVLSGQLSITVKSNDAFSGTIYLKIDNSSQYACDLVSSGRYFCYGPYYDSGEYVTITIHNTAGTKLASGGFTIPYLETIPANTEPPASTYP